MKTKTNSTTKTLLVKKETITVLNSMHLNKIVGGRHATQTFANKVEGYPITTCYTGY